jgi:hypothetical protein
VIIPPGNFQRLLEFFKTGRNPTHVWKGKGDWKAVYYMNEKNVEEKSARAALEQMLERFFVTTESGQTEKLATEINTVINKSKPSDVGRAYLNILLSEAQAVTSNVWFKSVYPQSDKLKKFYSNYRKLKTIVT